jgi:peptide/nickel transport system permease protein
MSALATPADPVPDAQLPATVLKARREALRRVPGKAKVGAVILGLFILIAIIGPWIAPVDTSATTPG